MLEHDAALLARQLMDHHGLHDWRLVFDRARRRAGMTIYSTRTISLSRAFLPKMSDTEIRDVILHEIAHALAGARHHHDSTWKKIAASIGAQPKATLPADMASEHNRCEQLEHEHNSQGQKNHALDDYLWIGTCPAGHTVGLYRRPSRLRSCPICCKRFSRDHVYQFRNTRTGHELAIFRNSYHLQS